MAKTFPLEKTKIFENYKLGWTFHSKMMFLEGYDDEYLASIGSSNFSDRSYERDHELDFFVYSKSKKFKRLLKKEIALIETDSKEFDSNNPPWRGIKGTIIDWVIKFFKFC